MVKIKKRRTKKFWSAVFFVSIGVIGLGISYTGNLFLVKDSWIWGVSQELTGLGLGSFLFGLSLLVFGKNVEEIK